MVRGGKAFSDRRGALASGIRTERALERSTQKVLRGVD